MRAAVIGGGLQGIEALYLARKAGWKTVLVDRDPDAPGAGLADAFVHLDAAEAPGPLAGVLREVDLILPALENRPALDAVGAAAEKMAVPYLFCPRAYDVTVSKNASNRLFERLGLPHPPPWPDCGFPVVVKPDRSSGSRGVRVIRGRWEMDALDRCAQESQHRVMQGYVDGPSFSIEVLGSGTSFVPLHVTDLHMDAGFDCKRVTAPTRLDRSLVEAFERMAVAIAEAVSLFGVMDIEVVLHKGRLELLEIDARLPSQTPMAVYGSTGYNMVQALGRLALSGAVPRPGPCRPQGVVVEHIHLRPDALETRGEHILRRAGRLVRVQDFFGADEALTDHDPAKASWAATLMVRADTLDLALAKRDRVIANILRHVGDRPVLDPGPRVDPVAPS